MDADARVELVFALSREDLAKQFAAIDELRTRVGSLIAAATIATGFLSAQTFTQAEGFPAGALVAAVAAVLLIGVCAWILKARTWQGDSLSTDVLLQWVDAGDDLDVIRREIAKSTRRHYLANRKTLGRLYLWFFVALLLLVVDFAGWFAALIGA